LRQILKHHGRIDFLLRSHAPAQGYPVCYEAEDPADLRFHNREKYIGRFVNTLRIVSPRFAIPFASNVCHLHSETIGFNRDHITPREVAERCREVFGSGSAVVVMMPGDSWDSETGFHLSESDAYCNPAAAISALSEQATPKLSSFYEEE